MKSEKETEEEIAKEIAEYCEKNEIKASYNIRIGNKLVSFEVKDGQEKEEEIRFLNRIVGYNQGRIKEEINKRLEKLKEEK